MKIVLEIVITLMIAIPLLIYLFNVIRNVIQKRRRKAKLEWDEQTLNVDSVAEMSSDSSPTSHAHHSQPHPTSQPHPSRHEGSDTAVDTAIRRDAGASFFANWFGGDGGGSSGDSCGGGGGDSGGGGGDSGGGGCD
ncbi:MAG: hypothetical protein VYD49_15740 [Pseudomonadota bacterium]|nr:hypothetical protein [Pseudomonadota bacterium]